MMTFEISFHLINLAANEALPTFGGDSSAVWVKSGSLDCSGRDISQGEGIYVSGPTAVATQPSTFVVFHISPLVAQIEPVLSARFEWEGHAVLRLDRVSFPPGARAYRHVHPGPGIRVLTQGTLEIRSDHDCTLMHNGDAWFEDANSPVQATAGKEPTAFVRAMVLPPEFLGKPTLRLLDAEDHDKPRLQTNTRFFDQIIDLSGP